MIAQLGSLAERYVKPLHPTYLIHNTDLYDLSIHPKQIHQRLCLDYLEPPIRYKDDHGIVQKWSTWPTHASLDYTA